jgi:hypothetical protein
MEPIYSFKLILFLFLLVVWILASAIIDDQEEGATKVQLAS